MKIIVQKKFKPDFSQDLLKQLKAVEGVPSTFEFEVNTETKEVFNDGNLVGKAKFLNDKDFLIELDI